MDKGAEFVHKDAERRDKVASRYQVDPKPEELTAADEMEKKREADKKSRLAAGLEAQVCVLVHPDWERHLWAVC